MNISPQRLRPQSLYLSDSSAATVIKAESELKVLEILCSVVGLSDVARDRIDAALNAVAAGLNVGRQQCGLQTHRVRMVVSA
jgi:hypothetical protein